MPRFIMTVGIAGVGKTTWAKKFAQENSNVVIHSSDEIRGSVYGSDYSYQRGGNKDVFPLMRQRTIGDLKKGKTVIYDATNIGVKRRKQLLYEIRTIVPELSLEAVYFDVPLDVALERNAQRSGSAKVPEEAIFRMSRHMVKPSPEEGWDRLTIVH